MADSNIIEISTYEATRAKRNELRAQVRAIEQKIADLTASVWQSSEQADDIDRAAEALLAGDAVPEISEDVERRLALLRRDLQIAQRALFLAGQAFAAAKDQNAQDTARELAPRHRAAVRRIAVALRDLADANATEQACRLECPEGNLRITPCAFPHIGHPDKIDSPAYFWFQHVRRHGLLDRDPAAIVDAAD